MLLTNSTAALPTSSAEAILHRVFRPLARYTLRRGGGGGGSRVTVVINYWASGVGFQLLLLLFNQIQQDDLCAAWPSFLTALLLCIPVTPSAENSRHTDCAGNPLQPISTGKFHVFQGVHHISPFFSLPSRIFLSIELSNR